MRATKTSVLSSATLLAALITANLASAQPAPQSGTGQDPAVVYAQEASARALDYRQGDRESLMDAQGDFTPQGWSDFMKRMDGFLDDKGAPTGSESFTATDDAIVKQMDGGIAQVSIPGTLAQTQNSSRTTYRVTVDVQVSGDPLKIQHLTVWTCGGASSASCK